MSGVVQAWSCFGGEMLPGKSNMYKGLVGLYTWLFSYLASLVSQSFSGVRSNLSPPLPLSSSFLCSVLIQLFTVEDSIDVIWRFLA